MPIVTTKKIQIDIASFMSAMCCLKEEVRDIYNAYWGTDASTVVPALSTGTTGATVESRLTKTEFVNGITFVEDLDDFFTNAAITQTDYLQTANQMQYGSASISTEVSNATEQLGNRLKIVGTNCINYLKDSIDILTFYNGNEIGDLIANLDTQRIVPGSDMTKDDLSLGVALVEQFKKMMTNEAVTTADYGSTVAKWQRF